MTWEETIQYIRTKPEYSALLENAYLDEDLALNVRRFKKSEEFRETLKLLRYYSPKAKNLLDIGCGNGISSIAFALEGYKVTACEPDPSDTVGTGAVGWLKENYRIADLEICGEYGEEVKLMQHSFDIVYVRQAMHHAYNLKAFVKNLASLVRHNGILVTIRDHVVYNDEEKESFLKDHPLHKYYQGENAFTAEEYKSAIEQSGLHIIKTLKHFDSVINYAPLTKDEASFVMKSVDGYIEQNMMRKIGNLAKIPLIKKLYTRKIGLDTNKLFAEKDISGRMYSFIARKK